MTKSPIMISMREYCPGWKRPLNAAELILEAVTKEDAYNHAHIPTPAIPKLTYPKHYQWKVAPSYAFFKQLLP